MIEPDDYPLREASFLEIAPKPKRAADFLTWQAAHARLTSLLPIRTHLRPDRSEYQVQKQAKDKARAKAAKSPSPSNGSPRSKRSLERPGLRRPSHTGKRAA